MSEQSADLPDQQPQPQYLLPASIQLANIFATEISAKRYPVEISGEMPATSSVNLEDIQIADDSLHAQVVLGIQINYPKEPKPFEISFKIVGFFAYAQKMPTEAVLQFLNGGSLSVMLPFARELLMHLCTRLQIPIIILPMIQLTPPHSPSAEESTQETLPNE